ncbi:MAG: hypothetical protein EA397_02575 [Deltaproteobacteria bacterium]|nr:MAG: hypothetical protein EA397_02575 [Deltaproteobacteria bacterium]
MTPPAIPGLGPRWARIGAAVLFSAYLFTMLAGSVKASWPQQLPGPVLYFTQVACLFPKAARMAIEYRVEAWSCSDQAFYELDPTPYFPIHANNKESRLHRAGFFYRRERVVMEALEDYLVRRVNEDVAQAERIGGIRLSSVRHPLPAFDERPVARFERTELSALPEDRLKAWFYTPVSRRARTCRVSP